MKKILALLLAVLMLLTCAACASQKPEPTEPTNLTTDPTTEPATDPTTAPVGDRTATYIQLSISEADGTYVSLTAYEDGEGKAYVEYSGEERKISTFELSVLDDIAAEVEKNFLAMNDQHVYEDGAVAASVYVGYSDESCLAADFSGRVPDEFRDGYAAVEAYFGQLMADVPVYVPRPVVQGDPDADALKAMEDILDASGAEPLDMFVIADVPMDDGFTSMMGLSKTDGIVNGLSCSPMMTSVAFSCMIATAENEAAVAAIADDFAANVQWNRWICVSATNALVATKGKQVLCLASSGDLFTQIANTLLATDWTVVKDMTN